jgi:hypothetical protein
MVTDDSPTTIVSNAFVSHEDALTKLGVKKCNKPWFTNHCSIASDIREIVHKSNHMSSKNVDSGTVCMSKGGQIHRGPPVENEVFRALIFFTATPKDSPEYHSDTQYNIFGLGDQLAGDYKEYKEQICTFLKSQLVMYLEYFTEEQLKKALRKIGDESVRTELLRFLSKVK